VAGSRADVTARTRDGKTLRELRGQGGQAVRQAEAAARTSGWVLLGGGLGLGGRGATGECDGAGRGGFSSVKVGSVRPWRRYQVR
jgi:hypothetical protein